MGGGYAYCAKPVLNFCFGEIPVLTGEICYLQCLVYKVLVQPTKKKKNGVSIERCLHQSGIHACNGVDKLQKKERKTNIKDIKLNEEHKRSS